MGLLSLIPLFGRARPKQPSNRVDGEAGGDLSGCHAQNPPASRHKPQLALGVGVVPLTDTVDGAMDFNAHALLGPSKVQAPLARRVGLVLENGRRQLVRRDVLGEQRLRGRSLVGGGASHLRPRHS
jgi:hypothetical protein